MLEIYFSKLVFSHWKYSVIFFFPEFKVKFKTEKNGKAEEFE